jgi:hypothetical protein
MPFDDLLAPLFAKVQLFDGLTRAEFGPPLKGTIRVLKRHRSAAELGGGGRRPVAK